MGHGNPMNAIQDNAYTQGWTAMAKDIPTPKAILVISAHWETRGGTRIYAGNTPKLIYDMYGFPRELYQVKYEVEGAPKIASEVIQKVNYTDIAPSHDWGLDHGAWSVLVKMFPEANIPCFQMSLNYTRELSYHYELAKELSFLRRQGVLILASGNIVHNLRYFRSMDEPATDWAYEFDNKVESLILDRNHRELIQYHQLGRAAEISVNSAEHYIPMLYALSLQESDDEVTFANVQLDQTLMGVGMRCFRIG